MKKIKWLFLSSEIDYGTEEEPNIKRTFIPKDFPYSDETLEAAKREAYNGEYEVYDDGLPEPEPEPEVPSEDSVWDELDAAYQEGVDSV